MQPYLVSRDLLRIFDQLSAFIFPYVRLVYITHSIIAESEHVVLVPWNDSASQIFYTHIFPPTGIYSDALSHPRAIF